MNLYTFTDFILCLKFNQIKLFLLCFLVSLNISAQFSFSYKWHNIENVYFKNGVERIDLYKDLINNKNIGLVVNHTSVIEVLDSARVFKKNIHLVDTLLKLNFLVNKIFSPEHGFKGSADAGAYIENDKYHNIPIVSLYGKKKKPNIEDLKEIEIMIFDIQDVGVRYYTYISTLHYIMEACAENDIPLIVLDRYNPNRRYIDGPILKSEYKSFIGMHPVPIVYGMTIGEYALMINGEKWLNDNLECDLKVIKVGGYYNDFKSSIFITSTENNIWIYAIDYTKFTWNYKGIYQPTFPIIFEKNLRIPPSPNLPNYLAINFYPSLCLFEGTSVSVGRGTDKPFQHFGSPYFPKNDHIFVPKSTYGSKSPKHINKICYGYSTDELIETFNNKGNLLILDWLIKAYQITSDKDDFFNVSFFDKLAGSSELRKQIEFGYTEQQIRDSWQKDLHIFKEIRSKYILYD